jgi:hypothetical protein
LPAQLVGNGLLSLVAAVQIGHGCAGRGVPHAVHQLTQVGARIGGELVAGMAQVVVMPTSA